MSQKIIINCFIIKIYEEEKLYILIHFLVFFYQSFESCLFGDLDLLLESCLFGFLGVDLDDEEEALPLFSSSDEDLSDEDEPEEDYEDAEDSPDSFEFSEDYEESLLLL